MVYITLFPNEYRAFLEVAPDAAQYAAPEPLGGWRLAFPPEVQEPLAQLVEQAVAQTEKDYLALGRQIWLTRPQITDEEYTRLDAEHGAAERRHRVLSRVLAALLDATSA